MVDQYRAAWQTTEQGCDSLEEKLEAQKVEHNLIIQQLQAQLKVNDHELVRDHDKHRCTIAVMQDANLERTSHQK
jgi:hypothetical protein